MNLFLYIIFSIFFRIGCHRYKWCLSPSYHRHFGWFHKCASNTSNQRPLIACHWLVGLRLWYVVDMFICCDLGFVFCHTPRLCSLYCRTCPSQYYGIIHNCRLSTSLTYFVSIFFYKTQYSVHNYDHTCHHGTKIVSRWVLNTIILSFLAN